MDGKPYNERALENICVNLSQTALYFDPTYMNNNITLVYRTDDILKIAPASDLPHGSPPSLLLEHFTCSALLTLRVYSFLFY